MKHSFTDLLKEALGEWQNDKGPRMGAALAFYSALSIGPLLVIVLALGGLLFAKNVLSDHLVKEMSALLGSDGADVITTIMAHSQEPAQGLLATVLGLVVLLIGASGVFGELQDALNTIWHVPAHRRKPWLSLIVSRFVSFAMVLGTGFILLVSLVLTAVLHAVTEHVNVAAAGLPYLMIGLNWLLSFLLGTGLFALIFKEIPEVKIRWADVWAGALLTALLFSIGKILIGLYLGHSAVRTTYGAAGSFVVFLIWIYYSAQILYFGAEFTKVRQKRATEPDTRPNER